MAERRQVERREQTRWQDASLFAKRNWLGALVLLLAILSAALTIKLISDSGTQQRNATYDNRLASNQGCDRANIGREAQVDDILDTRVGNLARARAWHGLIDAGTLPAPILQFAREQERANRNEAKAKLENATALVRSQEVVAAHPHAKDLRRRAIVACDAVYPLPEHRGEGLPQPTLP